jgi:hypothetical protein
MNPTNHNGQENKGQNAFFLQKSEKLATAVYMITDIIDSREPVRWKIREEAMEILSLMSAPLGDASSKWNVLYRITQAIERIEHILMLARNAKLISSMNASVVMKEYAELKEKVANAWGDDSDHEPLKLNHQFFKVDALPVVHPRRSFPQPELKRTIAVETPAISQHITVQQKIVTDTPVVKTDTQSDIPKLEGKKTDRRSVILALLKVKPELSVSDALKEFPGVSDKTVQRELVAMVESGILQKKGEKRWSTYSLKN